MGVCYLFFPYAIILSCLEVQWSPNLKKLRSLVYAGLVGCIGYVYMCAFLRAVPIKKEYKIPSYNPPCKNGAKIRGYHRGLYFKLLFYTLLKCGVLSYRSIAYQALYPGRKKASFGLNLTRAQWLPRACNQ